jgi:hypothetical protein
MARFAFPNGNPSFVNERRITVEIPGKFTSESFGSFDMRDDEVGPGECRTLAIELKRLFEGIAADADEQNEEIFLEKEL